MALQGQTVDVPLQPMNQQATATGGPVGRLKHLVNAVAKKITRAASTTQPTDAGVRLRAEKRDGFAQLPSAVRDPATGATSSKTMVSHELIATYRNQLIAVFLASPFVLSEAAGCWEAPAYTCPTQVLRERHIAVESSTLAVTSQARVGSRTLFAWSAAGGIVRATIVDDDGTVVLASQVILQGSAPLVPKVVSDGSRFWVVVSFASNGHIWCSSCDTNGVGIATFNINVVQAAGTYVDVTVDPASVANLIFVAQKNGIGQVTLTRYTWNGAAVLDSSAACAFVACSTGRLAFFRNDTGDGNIYLAAIDGAGPFSHSVWQITTPTATPGNGHQYALTPAPIATAAFQMAGFVAPTVAKDVTATLSFLDVTGPAPQLNSTQVKTVTFAGVTTTTRIQRSLTVVSNPIRLSGNYYVVCYYRSNPAAVTNVAQSTFFLLALSAPWQICGRWEFGTAYADWCDTVTPDFYMALSTPTLAPDGGVHLSLPYRASSSVAIQFVGDVFNQVRHSVDVVGVKDWSFGPDFGRAVDLGSEILMPGPQAVAYSGASFAEDGIPLLFEVPAPPTQGGGGSLTVLGTYQYVFVGEWTNASGERVRGPAGPPINVTLTGANNKITVVGYNIHETQKDFVFVAGYRTVMNNGIQSSIHYKVTGTLIGGTFGGAVVLSDDGSDTWTLVDTLSDAAARLNEQLYVDSGLLDRFPAPPFSIGCRAFDRAFLVAPDNSIWFSGEKTEGDAFWWNPAQRILLPTHGKVKAIVQLDNFLLVMCDSSAMFSIPGGPFPDATGVGTIPQPVLLPFTSGCTGFAELTDQGVMYSSSQGGLWMITRDLRNVYVGAAVEDDTAAGIFGSASDDKQRVMFVARNGVQIVYDGVTNCWYTWLSSAFDVLPSFTSCPATSHKGRFVLLAAGSPSPVYRQVIGQYSDAGVAIPTTIEIDFMHFAGIRGYVRTWESQLRGLYYGDHDLAVQGFVDDDLATLIETYQFTPTAGAPYIYALPPKVELCASRSYRFTDSFPRGPSQGFALEAISFFVGVEKGLRRLPAVSSIKPT